jgi:hypothetical protein
MNPFDVVSTRLYNQHVQHVDTVTGKHHAAGTLYRGPLHCLTETARVEGLRGLYKGFWAHYLRLGPHTVRSAAARPARTITARVRGRAKGAVSCVLGAPSEAGARQAVRPCVRACVHACVRAHARPQYQTVLRSPASECKHSNCTAEADPAHSSTQWWHWNTPVGS